MAENTLFKITKKDEKTNLVLEKGIMNASLSGENDNYLLNLHGKEYKLSSKNAQVQVEKNEQKERMIVLDGEAYISGDETKRKLQKNQYFEYDKKTKKEKISTLEIIPKYPQNGMKIFFIESVVDFTWDSSSSEKEFSFILARDSSFKDIVWRGDVRSNKKRIKGLDEGVYFWKVKKGVFDSGIRSFKMVENLPPRILHPTSESVFYFQKKETNDYVVLGWSGEEKLFELELTTAKGVRKINVKNDKYVLEAPASGIYKFRVRVNHGKMYSPWSSYTSFVVDRKTPPPPPAIISPMSKSRFVLFGDGKKDVNLIWFPVRNLTNYHVILKNNGDVIYDDKFIGNKLKVHLEEGEYSWKVRTIDMIKQDEMTRFSDMKTFVIKRIKGGFYPEDGSKFILPRPNHEIEIGWSFEKPNKSYTLQISKAVDFKNVKIKRTTKKNVLRIPFDELGTYFWRVKVLTPGNKIFYSKVFKMMLEPTAPPKRPEIDNEIELKIDYKQKGSRSFIDWFIGSAYAEDIISFVKIQWSPQDNISKYILEIYEDEDMKKRLVHKKLKKTFYEFENIRAGIYYWRLAVVDFWDRASPFSDLSRLIVKDINERRHEKKEILAESHLQEIEEEKKIISVKRTVPTPSIKHKKNIDIFYGPVKMDYELSSEIETMRIDGTILNSFIISGQYHLNKKIISNWLVGYQGGEVFDDLDYSSFHIQYLSGYSHKWLDRLPLKHKLGIMFQTSSIYRSVSFLQMEEEKKISLSLLAGLEFKYNIGGKWTSIYNVLFGFGSMSLIDLDILFKYLYDDQVSYNSGIKLQKKGFSSDYGDLDESDLQFFIGMSYSYY